MNPSQNHRRTFLADAGMGFTGMVLGSLLDEDGFGAAPQKKIGKRQAAASSQGKIGHLDFFGRWR